VDDDGPGHAVRRDNLGDMSRLGAILLALAIVFLTTVLSSRWA
jgi:hypothetical protein